MTTTPLDSLDIAAEAARATITCEVCGRQAVTRHPCRFERACACWCRCVDCYPAWLAAL